MYFSIAYKHIGYSAWTSCFLMSEAELCVDWSHDKIECWSRIPLTVNVYFQKETTIIPVIQPVVSIDRIHNVWFQLDGCPAKLDTGLFLMDLPWKRNI